MVRLGSARFNTDDRGAVAIIFALSMTAIFGALAFAVDYSRAFRSEARIAIALDAAALAGTKGLDSGRSDAEITSLARAMFDQTMAGRESALTMSNFTVLIDRWTDTVTVSTDARMQTSFGRVIGTNEIDLSGLTTVRYRIRRVELALSLDVTGSMNRDIADDGIVNYGRLNAMKQAANQITSTMFAEAPADDRVRVALVPWSTAVNLGPMAAAVSGNTSVDQCVIERLGTNAATDEPPYGSDAVRAFSPAPGDYTCPTASVVPLLGRNRAGDLMTAINAMTGDGGTAGHIGTAWGWYTLAPAWSGIWPTDSRPRDYGPDTIKSVLIMTDGQFNVSWKTVTSWSSNQTLMMNESYSQFQALCSAMKAKNVVVYTIGFGLKETRAIDEMRTCASAATSFFQAASDAELTEAFQKVAEDLKAMRITR